MDPVLLAVIDMWLVAYCKAMENPWYDYDPVAVTCAASNPVWPPLP